MLENQTVFHTPMRLKDTNRHVRHFKLNWNYNVQKTRMSQVHNDFYGFLLLHNANELGDEVTKKER